MLLSKSKISVKTLSKSDLHLGKAMMIPKKKRKSRKKNSNKRKILRPNRKKLSHKILTTISCSVQFLKKNIQIQILPRMKKVLKIHQKSHTSPFQGLL